MIALVEGVVVLLIAGVVMVLIVQTWANAQRDPGPTEAERAELTRLRNLVEELKELAWDHREIDPDLATILLHKIRSSERDRRHPGDP